MLLQIKLPRITTFNFSLVEKGTDILQQQHRWPMLLYIVLHAPASFPRFTGLVQQTPRGCGQQRNRNARKSSY